jgi:ribosome small subunit-dependent GTPase A
MTTLERYGFGGEIRTAAGCPSDGESFGRVVSAHGDYYHLVADVAEGEILARKKSSAFREPSSINALKGINAFNGKGFPKNINGLKDAKAIDAVQPTTGSFVRCTYNRSGESRITGVLPRFAVFERVDPSSSGRRAQTIAVNFDTLFFLMSANENFSMARLERVLELADASGCRRRLVVLLTKSDLAGEDQVAGWKDQVGTSGVPVLAVSAKTGAGLDGLDPYVAAGRTLAFIGSSGVGKSSLVNALAGEEWMATQEIQSWSGKGRHTTTSRELVMLPSGVMVIDTPGMRELGLLGRDGTHRFHSSGTHRYRR